MKNIYDCQPGRRLLGGLGHRLGGRPLLHRLRPLLQRQHHRPLRRQAGRHARSGAFWRVISQHGVNVPLHRAHRVSGHQEGRSRGNKHIGKHDLSIASRPSSWPASAATRHPRTGPRRAARRAGHRPLVADRDRMVDLRQLHGHRPAARQERLPDQAGPGHGRACRRPRANEMAPGDREPWWSSCRSRRAPSLPCGTPRSASYETYLAEFPGYYKTFDAGIIDDDGYVHVMSRTDDIINTAGHRLSTGAMEEVLADHPDVAECAVMGVSRRSQRPGARRLLRAQGGRASGTTPRS